MKKYKLIKTYPESLPIGTVVEEDKYRQFVSKDYVILQKEDVYDYPEFWEEVVELDYEVLKYEPVWDNNDDTRITARIVVVKRLSDGEVFTLGDKVEYIDEEWTQKGTIGDFYINKQRDCIVHDIDGYQTFSENINLIKKIKNTPLFTTEDGVELFEGDKVVVIKKGEFKLFDQYHGDSIKVWTNGWYSHGISSDIEKFMRDGYLFFQSKENAEEYILMNKPCLSINDIDDMWDNTTGYRHPQTEYLKKIVRSRL